MATLPISRPMARYPCVACGFLVFDEPVGSYAVCPVCDWEDDHVQLRFPGSPVGANHTSLFDYQRRTALRLAPLGIDTFRGFRRLSAWRPLRPDEAIRRDDEPATGRAYFDALGDDDPAYYWEEDGAPGSRGGAR